MKAINNFIIERLKLNKDTQAKDINWELTQIEKNALRDIFGYMTGFWKSETLYDKSLRTLYNRYRAPQKNLIKHMFTVFKDAYKLSKVITNYDLENDEIDLLRKIIIYLKDNNLMGDYEADLLSVLNKI